MTSLVAFLLRFMMCGLLQGKEGGYEFPGIDDLCIFQKQALTLVLQLFFEYQFWNAPVAEK